MEDVKKKILLLICILALCNLTLIAQTASQSRVAHVPEKSAVHTPPQERPEGLRVIYSNLGTKTDLYNDSEGWVITGFNTFGGDNYAFEIGLPFTPKSNSHVSQVRAALQYQGQGATSQ